MKLFDLATTSAPVFFRTYSRWLGQFGRRETWAEVVTRCTSGFSKIGNLKPEQLELIAGSQVNGTVMPSGRWLWVGGTDWIEKQANFYGAYNCFQGDTLVNTLEFGSEPIKELVGKQVSVVNKNHEWVPVEFKEYGIQPLYEITMRRGVSSGTVKTIQATANHLWHLESGETTTTIDLKPGSHIPFVTANRPTIQNESIYILGVRHGIIYGDGSYSDSSTRGLVNFKVRLCGGKSELLQYFDGCNISYPPSYNGDPVANVKGRDFIEYVPNIDLKDLPDTDDLDYLLGFFRGLLATDGSVSSGDKSSLYINICGKLETLLWLEKLTPKLGIENGTMRCLYEAGTESNYGVRKTSTYQLLLYPGSIILDDLIQSKHKQKFGSGMKQASLWRVLDVQDIAVSEIVYCCEEPLTNTFVLTGGILTGNCNSTNINTLESFANVMDLLMQGCGVGVCLERKYVEQLPSIVNFLVVRVLDAPVKEQFLRAESTGIDFYENNHITITVGDSRQGWVDALYQLLSVAALNLSVDGGESRGKYTIAFDLSNIRPDGERIEGFGGVSKSTGLGEFFKAVAEILNDTQDNKLTPVQCALLVCTIGKIVVAGNVRRSAIIQQFDADNIEAEQLKSGMWKQVGEDWIIDPKLDCMRMANLTRVFHKKPTLQQCIDSITEQFNSGEGAIQWAGEAVARSNADLLNDEVKKQNFLDAYNLDPLNAKCYLANMMGLQPDIENIKDNNNFELEDRMSRYKLNPCGEILQNNNFCNLSEVHLNQIDPLNTNDQKQAFQAAGLSVVVLLHHEFNKTVYQTSRELDPIVGVSFTGLFDFFVNAFGSEWLRWWSEDRNPEFRVSAEGRVKLEAVLKVLGVGQNVPNLFEDGYDGTIYSQCEKIYLKMWQITAEQTVRSYCVDNNIKCPNRFTTVQPSGTKSLLTGASPGWHPPIAQRYIRRVTFAAHDPVALACIEYGYTVIPSQKDKDEDGNLLHDAYDLRCTEWLIEIPTEVPWANLAGACDYDLNHFSAHAQFDFYMTVQQWYTQHNTSATISFRKHEIEELATAIHEAIDTDAGYISIALLARFDANETFPRLPFEPISLEKYTELQNAVLSRRYADGQPVEFGDLLIKYDSRDLMVDAGCAPCDSEKCEVVGN